MGAAPYQPSDGLEKGGSYHKVAAGHIYLTYSVLNSSTFTPLITHKHKGECTSHVAEWTGLGWKKLSGLQTLNLFRMKAQRRRKPSNYQLRNDDIMLFLYKTESDSTLFSFSAKSVMWLMPWMGYTHIHCQYTDDFWLKFEPPDLVFPGTVNH